VADGVDSASASRGSWYDLKWESRPRLTGMIALGDPGKGPVEKGIHRGNGLWGAFGMPEAVRTTTHVTTTDKDAPIILVVCHAERLCGFACHKVGVPSWHVDGIAGNAAAPGAVPGDGERGVLGAQTATRNWNPPTGLFHVVKQPIYSNVLLHHRQRGIDAGGGPDCH